MRISYEFDKDEPPEKCPEGRFIKPNGGFFATLLKGLYECPISEEIIEQAASWKQDKMYESYPRRPNHLLFLSTQCARCALKCEVVVEMDGKEPTGDIQLIYSNSDSHKQAI